MERAAISLAVSAVSAIFTKLEEKAASYFGGDITDDDLENLQTQMLPMFQYILEMADEFPAAKLKPWLMKLQYACYEAEDVIDMYEYKRLKYEVSSLPNFVKKLKNKAREFVAPITLKTELRKSMEKLQKSFDKAKELFPLCGVNFQVQATLVKKTSKEEAQRQTVSSTSSLVFGREKDRDFLANMLISPADQSLFTEGNNVPVHAIIGLGGAGKTTLAQLVYNDPKVVNHFDRRIWVYVSRKFDVHKITTELIEAIQRGGSSHVSSLDVLQSKLKELLSSKRFLIIFDDVWCEKKVQWDQMLIPLNDVGDLNCRVVITARAEEVSKALDVKHIFRLPEVEPSDYWSIFKHYSVGDAEKDIDGEMLEIANQIVKKLSKSPLAARMVGSLLKKNHSISYWKQILNQDILKDTMDCLYLSFQQLPRHLRQCFAFCSLYPKGHNFYTNDKNYKFDHFDDCNLVHIWIAQGFVEGSKSNEFTFEEKGMQYFNELVSYSFFLKIDDGDYYVIHDLLHDLAEKVYNEHCFRIERGGPITIPETTMHLSIGKDHQLSISSILPQIFKLPNLRTFLVFRSVNKEELGAEFLHKIFEKLKKLRVLCFEDFTAEFEELPKSIGKLKYLRYFQLGGVKKLHESLGGLYHLQYLNIGKQASINKVPESMNNLINLRVLEPEVILSSIPCLKKLSHLQHCKYSINASSKEQHGMHKLKHLQELRRLEIINLQNVKDNEEASTASLKENKLLNELLLSWEDSSDRDGRTDEEVAEGLEPPPNLGEIQIDGYNGLSFPTWLQNDKHFSHLSKLSIKCCSNVKQLLTLPATLTELSICYCENLSEVSRLPPNLEVLKIRKCPGFVAMLSNILIFDVDHEEKEEEHKHHQHHQQQFCLKTLKIDGCSSRGEKRFIFDPKAALFTSLADITLDMLPWLTSVHLECNMTSLFRVIISTCGNLESFRSSLMECNMTSYHQKWLRHLAIYQCPMLARKQQEAAATTIKEWCFDYLNIDGPSLLTALVSSTSGNCLTSLKELRFGRVVAIFTPEEEDLLQHLTLPSLYALSFFDCCDLPSLPLSLHKLSSLTFLEIVNCHKIESLPNLPASLETLVIIANTELKRNYEEGGPLYHQISHIPNVKIYE